MAQRALKALFLDSRPSPAQQSSRLGTKEDMPWIRMSLKSGAALREVGTTLVKTLAMPVPTRAYRVPPAQALSQGVVANSSRHQL